jgi:hypothetical protein
MSNLDGRYGLINHPYLYLGVEIVSANFAAGVDSGRSTLLVDTGGVTVTLPLAADNQGHAFWIKNVAGAGAVTILPTAPDLIDGVSAGGGGLSLPDQYDVALVVSDGTTNWYVLSFSNL